jgi:hypothetical protein
MTHSALGTATIIIADKTVEDGCFKGWGVKIG